MTGTNTKLTAAAESYFADLGRVRASGGATGERSSYGPLANLLNTVGATLKPKVFCVGELADQGAGHPDFGLYAAKQVQRGRPREGQIPERGVVEVKSSHEDMRAWAVREQVGRYRTRYRLVLMTNLLEFVLVGEDSAGHETTLETFRLAGSDEEFERRLQTPRAFAREVGTGLGEYLCRALSHRAALTEPKDLAWLLASYARDGLARVEAAGDAPSLKAVRSALEEALGVRFEGDKGARFFHSTLVQTLFYGVFSAWVLWARAGEAGGAWTGVRLRDHACALQIGGARRSWKRSTPLANGALTRAAGWTGVRLDASAGLTMQELDAPLADVGTERPGIFLTNALTGWEPRTTKPLPFPELEEERDRAERVKQETPILVILGNPPYNGFAGMAVDEERELSEAYRTTKQVRRPEGQGLNDLYVRFFRMAEKRIAEKTGRGVVCFISNYSWLDGLSFTGMRERYLEAFDAVRIDCLNGDKYKTGKVAPDGSPDPSIFSTEGEPVGIQVGTAIATLVRKADHKPVARVGFRHLWGQAKPAELTATAEAEPDAIYEGIKPVLPLGLPFVRTAVSEDWFEWPALPDLFPVSFPGVKTSRDGFLVDVDLDRLRARVTDYFDAGLSHDEVARRYPGVMKTTARFNARAVRDALLNRGGPDEAGFIRVAYRPFDYRWLYWERDTKLLDEKRTDYRPHVFEENVWLVLQNKARPDLSPPLVISNIGDLNQMNSGVYCVPVYLGDDGLGTGACRRQCRPNLSGTAQAYIKRLDASVMDLFHHAIAVLHDSTYNQLNADALRAEGPRLPLPGWPDGAAEGAAQALAESAARGRELAALLNPETPVPGVTQAPLRPEVAAVAVPATVEGRNMTGDDFAVTTGWGHYGQGDSVMPGQGHAIERAFTPEECTPMGSAPSALGATTFDIHLNGKAFWRNIPAAVWNYKLGGYQVLKKWLSYRERDVLGRSLRPEEVQYFTHTARRIMNLIPKTVSK